MLLAAGFLFAGCASHDAGSQSQPAAQNQAGVPVVGMTKEQVIGLYGKTDDIRLGSHGETWVYNLNRGEVFIPWNLGYRPKLRVVDFDQHGQVKSFSSSQ